MYIFVIIILINNNNIINIINNNYIDNNINNNNISNITNIVGIYIPRKEDLIVISSFYFVFLKSFRF